ncbi:enoyl-CoA hydratase/isomerase family protein [Undibacterium sp. Ren11W]|uniref:enoyl-CoA hydratase/isomerase family protein n=1 Tax=Undibacterium sp. Ren11W TaxID=3413045 RepID=UPI003BF1DAD8
MSEVFCQVVDQIAFVTLSNPGKLNALDVVMWDFLRKHFDALSSDENLRCIILRGADKNFAAGADIEEFASVRNSLTSGMHYHNQTIALALASIAQCQHPVIAAIEGVCVGGGLEIACACDIRIAAPTARFGIPINRLGFPLAPGELQGLLALTGSAIALEILLEGRVFSATEAKEKGLIQRIADDVQKEAMLSANRIAAGAPLAARANKRMIRRLTLNPEALSKQEMTEAFVLLESADYSEGINSFLEKRPAQFIGK